MADLWMGQDAPDILLTRLTDALRDDGTVVRTSVPDGWTPGDGYLVIVNGDGPQRSARGTDRELVRVTCRARDQWTARKIMQLIDSWLTTPGIQFLGLSIIRSRGTGIISGPDSLVGGAFASATYSVGTTRKVVSHGA